MNMHLGEWLVGGVLTVAFYGTGLLLWPLKRFFSRHHHVQGKGLLFVFLGQILSYLIVGGLCSFSRIHLEHGYYWFIILILLNILFTIAGVVAWICDALWEAQTEVKSTDKPNSPANGSKPFHSE